MSRPGMRLIGLLAILMLCGVVGVRAADMSSLETQKIEFLLASIEALQNARFIRNGTAYDAKAASDHLRLKLSNAGSKVKSAEDFIRVCASVSSLSGKPYLVRFSDGRQITAEDYFNGKLREYLHQIKHLE